MRPIREWLAGSRDAEHTEQAWRAAVCLPLSLIRRDVSVPIVVTIVPACVWAVIVLDVSWLAFFPLFAGSMVALGYSAILHYLILETGMRPVLLDISESDVAPRVSGGIPAISLRVRLMAALPLINLITGLVVAALTSSGGGGAALGADVLDRGGGGDDDLARAHRPVLEVDPPPDQRPPAGDRGAGARDATTSWSR